MDANQRSAWTFRSSATRDLPAGLTPHVHANVPLGRKGALTRRAMPGTVRGKRTRKRPMDRPEATEHRNTPSAADALLRTLRARGVDYFLANPGTDFPPIIEGFARAAE